MKRKLFLLLVLALPIAHFTLAEPRFPMLGLWRATELYNPDGKQVISEEKIELEFLSDGVLIFTGTRPKQGITSPIRLRAHYTFQPPDVITYALDGGQPVLKRRFTLTDDGAILEDVGNGSKAWFRRIESTEFTETPKELVPPPK